MAKAHSETNESGRAPGGPDAPVGMLFANATGGRQFLDIPIRPEEYGFSFPCAGTLFSGFGGKRIASRECGSFYPGEERHLPVTLAPRQVVLLELRRVEPGISH